MQRPVPSQPNSNSELADALLLEVSGAAGAISNLRDRLARSPTIRPPGLADERPMTEIDLEPPASATSLALTKRRGEEPALGSSIEESSGRPPDAGTTPSRRSGRWSARTKSRVATLVWSLVLLVVGGKGLFWVVGDTRLILESAQWVPGTAIVSRAWIETSRARRGIRGSSPRVEYRYSVEGRPYVGSRLEIPARRYSSKWEAREKLAGLRPGATIPILYDPTDPAKSVIVEPTMNWFFTLGLGGLSVALLAWGLLLLRSSVRSGMPESRACEPRAEEGGTELAR